MTPNADTKNVFTTHEVSKLLQVNPGRSSTGSSKICCRPTGRLEGIGASAVTTSSRFSGSTKSRFLRH